MGRLEKTFIVVNIALIVLYVLFLVIINLPMLQYGKKYEITSPSYNENIDSIVFINENVMVTTLKNGETKNNDYYVAENFIFLGEQTKFAKIKNNSTFVLEGEPHREFVIKANLVTFYVITTIVWFLLLTAPIPIVIAKIKKKKLNN